MRKLSKVGIFASGENRLVAFFFHADLQLEMSNNSNAALIQEFITISGASRVLAEKYLNKNNFSLARSVDSFYADGNLPVSGPTTAQPKRRKTVPRTCTKTAMSQIESFFKTYANKSSHQIEPNEISNLSSDLCIDPLDVVWLIIAESCQAKTMGYFTQSEWTTGMIALECYSLEDLKEAIPRIRDSVRTELDTFREVYGFTFRYALDSGARNISLETATALWDLILPLSGWPMYCDWISFVQSESVVKKSRAITKDVWTLLYDFSQAAPSKESLVKFDIDGVAWPVLIDDFYEYVYKSSPK